MVRIKCNICGEYKNLKAENYDKMIRRFGFTRSFIFGVTHGIEAVVRNKPIGEELDREKTEQAFSNVYVCQQCKNNKKDTIKVTQSISRVLNLPRDQPKIKEIDDEIRKKRDKKWQNGSS